ncbi:MAG: hypothetical protein KDB00_12335 [Planctomycetales bacterium]|nr:hypothetical protein [Planctomycetales bacterium]
MAKMISQSVGTGGYNKYEDVLTVQELINDVPADEGRPVKPLKEDGLCGPKTKDAIGRFQLKHFGWSGADSRVDPGGQTINKLNELAKPKTKPLPKPLPKVTLPKPPQPSKRPSTRYGIIQAGEKDETIVDGSDFFFVVIDFKQPNVPQVYWLGPPGGYKTLRRRVKVNLRNIKGMLDLAPPGLAITALSCKGIYMTRSSGGKIKNELWMKLNPRTKVVPMQRVYIPVDSASGQFAFARDGQFQLVENPGRWIDVVT